MTSTLSWKQVSEPWIRVRERERETVAVTAFNPPWAPQYDDNGHQTPQPKSQSDTDNNGSPM